MTLPCERANSIENTREFLRRLLDPKATPRIPRKVRTEAYWCLKHFPSPVDMEEAIRQGGGRVFDTYEED